MGLKDKIKWDKKYQETPSLLKFREASNKLHTIINQIEGTKVLDVACGAGRNAIYLAKEGFEVEALDISQIALDTLNSHGYKNITTQLIDLDEYTPTLDSYNLIVMTNFLDRDIIPQLALSLKKDGILFVETYMEHEINEKPNSNPDFLLKAGELKTFFDDSFELLEYDEFLNESYELYKMMKQSIIVRKKEMNTVEAIKQRRSIRNFNDKKIEDKDIQTILECAMCAPTARNQQGFRFIVLDDESILNDIASNIEHGKMCKDASHAIVVCYEVKDESSKLYWVQDGSATTQNILLSATDLGIGSVWVAIHPREAKIDFVTNYFKLPQTIKPLCIVALGYKENFLKEVNRFDKSKVWYNTLS